jgi:thioredoxin family protein
MPLTPKEVSLMLRSGYSSETIVREISQRHFAGPLDSLTENQLIQAGATQALMDALRANTYQASSAELAALQQKLAKQEESAVESETQLKRAENVKDDSASRSNVTPASAPTDALYRLLKGDLISFHQGAFSHFDDAALEHKKLYLLFFSANWSPVGRKFTSQLIDYYNRIAPEHPEFELIFFSVDRSQFGMETYMSESNMPWPAVVFDKVAEKLTKMPNGLVREIPFLALTDASGNITSFGGTSDDKNNLKKVITDLDRTLSHAGADSIAPNR